MMTSPTVSPAKIHLIDDDASVRTAIGRLLRGLGYQVCLYASANEFLAHITNFERGCILLDVQMPGLSGPQLQQELIERGCPLPIIFLTGHGDIPTTVRAIKAGAEDFLAKPARKEALAEAIERALKRYDETFVRVAETSKHRERLTQLTPREHEVLNLVIRGKLNKQIAHELGASERTIKAHRHSVMAKLQVRSLAELVSVAEHLGLLA
jgi:FixJ family two-component response regulator